MHEKKQRTGTQAASLGLLLALAACARTAEPSPEVSSAPSNAAPPAPSVQQAATEPQFPADATFLADTLAATVAAAAATPAAAAPPAAAAAKPAPKRKAHLLPCPPNVPEELNPPADATLELVLPANGVQGYACTVEKPGAAPDWNSKGPHALLSEGNNVVGIHFGGPSWQGLDGSTVKGTKLASAPGPDKSAVSWLLLSGAATGEGTFGKITHIQRMQTVGGKPPEGGCDQAHLDTKVLIPYHSNYFFYRLSEPGETVRQCRSAPGKAEKKGAK